MLSEIPPIAEIKLLASKDPKKKSVRSYRIFTYLCPLPRATYICWNVALVRGMCTGCLLSHCDLETDNGTFFLSSSLLR
jgi:hypothetical protein